MMRAFLFAVLLSLAPAWSAEVELLKVKGAVSVSSDEGKNWTPLAKKIPLSARDWLKTEANAWACLRFGDGSLTRIASESVVVIKEARKEAGDFVVRLDLKEGRISAIAARPTDGSKFEVLSVGGVCGARGDGVRFDVTSSGHFRCERGRLVTIYVVSGIISPITLEDGEEVQPAADIFKSTKHHMKKCDMEGLVQELDELERTAGAGGR